MRWETLWTYYALKGDLIKKYLFLLLLFLVPIATATTIYQDVIFAPNDVNTNFTFTQNTEINTIQVHLTNIEINDDYFSAISDSGNLLIEIYNFSTTGDLYKQFNATNTIQDNVTYFISGYTSGQNVSLYLDSILNDSYLANATGYINFEFNLTNETNITLTTTDVTAPVISNPTPTNGSILVYTTTTTILSIITDEISECRYNTTSGQDFTNMTAFTNTNSTTHNSTITVTNGTTYNYYIKCNDSEGNINLLDYYLTFSVADTPITPPASGGGGGAVCDYTHLYLCDNLESCEFYGGYWYNETCNEEPLIYVPYTPDIINETINDIIDLINDNTGVELDNVNISYEDIDSQDLLDALMDASIINLPQYELIDGEYVLTGYVELRPSSIIDFISEHVPSINTDWTIRIPKYSMTDRELTEYIEIQPFKFLSFEGDLSDRISSFLNHNLLKLPIYGEENTEININVSHLILPIILLICLVYKLSKNDKEK